MRKATAVSRLVESPLDYRCKIHHFVKAQSIKRWRGVSDGTAAAFPIAVATISQQPPSSCVCFYRSRVKTQGSPQKTNNEKNVQTADSGGLLASHADARPNMSSGVSGLPVSGLISKPRDPISQITCV